LHANKVALSGNKSFEEYDIDQFRALLGKGESVYKRAVEGIKSWKQFQLDWVDLHYPSTPIAVGSNIAIAANSWGIWTLSASRIVYVIEDQEDGKIRKFGFGYGTLPTHVERGEERFLIEWNLESDEVFYDILAFSLPQTWFVKMSYPVARYFQRLFSETSAEMMQQWVKGETPISQPLNSNDLV